MTLRQTIQAAPGKATELIAKLAATSNQAVKTREGLFAQLNDELSRYVEIEEQHLLPLLQKHPKTKDLAGDALKGNKDLRASLEKLAALPKDNDGFLAELTELNKGFQQYVRNERKELLPAVLDALSDEEATALATNIEQAVADAETSRRDEKREEAAQAKRQAEEVEQAAAAKRSVVRAQKAVERNARGATEKVVETIARGTASMQDGARRATENITERAQEVALETREAMTVYGDSVQKVGEDMQAVRASSAVSVKALSEVRSAWLDWLSDAARLNVETAQQLIQCRTVTQVAKVQREFATKVVHNWMEGSTKVLQITQRTSKEALSPLDGRLSKAS